ncbi:MAG: ArsA family ATPase [Longimicrobiales bacterium]|nr:ArsA family ATPase [Longimicrobiales bacterium]
MLPFRDQSVVFVGGKGGVGKTTTASALAVHRAESGESVLLVSTDPAHSLGDLFDRRLGDEETELIPGLFAVEIDPEREVDRYLKMVKRNLRELVRPEMYGDIDRQLELTRMSPGAQEAALLERTSRILKEGPERFDRVIFDTAPTGSTLRLLSLPEVMTAWMEGLLERRERAESFRESLRGTWAERPGGSAGSSGRSDTEEKGEEEGRTSLPRSEDERAERIREVLTDRRRRFARARAILQDPSRCAFLLVVLPEKLPILEGHRAYETLRSARVPVTAVVVNRVLPEGPLGEFLEHRREQEEAYLQEIEDRFGDLPRIRVPLLEEDVGSLEGVRVVARHLVGGAVDSSKEER